MHCIIKTFYSNPQYNPVHPWASCVHIRQCTRACITNITCCNLFIACVIVITPHALASKLLFIILILLNPLLLRNAAAMSLATLSGMPLLLNSNLVSDDMFF